MYEDLVYATPGLQASQIGRFFKDASFGVRPGDVERSYTPLCSLPTAPAIGRLRAGQDRARPGLRRPPHLRLDARRSDVRAPATRRPRTGCSSSTRCAMPAAPSCPRSPAAAEANREMDHDVWADQPYTEAELQLQFDRGDDLYGAARRPAPEGRRATTSPGSTSTSPRRASNPLKMPGEYAAIDRPQGPGQLEGHRRDRDRRRWSPGSSAGRRRRGRLGAGPGGGAGSGSAASKGKKVWADFRSAEDPEAPTTVHKHEVPVREDAAEGARPARCPTPAASASRRRSRRRAARRTRARRPRRELLQGLQTARRRAPTRCSSRAASRSRATRWRSWGPRSATSRRRS